MNDARFSMEEFKAVFPGPYESKAEMLREYQSFLQIVEQAGQAAVPELSAGDRAAIFRRTWPARPESRPSLFEALAFWRRPAVTFALGLAFGAVLMFGCLRVRAESPEAPTEQVLTIEHLGDTQAYGGKVLQGLYPQIEDPKIVVEKTEEAAEPRRVLYGTLDEGEVYVVWNL